MTRFLKGFFFSILMLNATQAIALEARVNPEQIKQKMRENDLDNSGSISKIEFMKQAEARFNAADTDKNGEISAEELEAARQRMLKQLPQ